MTKTSLIALMALAPAASIAAPLPANLPVYGQAPGAVPPPVAEQPAAYSYAETPSYGVQPAFVDIQPRWAWSLDFVYGFNAAPHSQFASDVFGFNIQGAWCFTPRQSLTLDIGYAGGTDHERLTAVDGHHMTWHESYRFYRSRFSLMAGYEFRQPLNAARNVHFYAAAKAGLDVDFLNVSDGDRYSYYHGYYYEDFHTKGTAGFGYAFGAGFAFRISQTVHVNVGYQYFGSTAEPDISYHSHFAPTSSKLNARSMRWHEVHAGLSVRF